MNNSSILVFKSFFIYKILVHPKRFRKIRKIQKKSKDLFWGFKIRTPYLGVNNPSVVSLVATNCDVIRPILAWRGRLAASLELKAERSSGDLIMAEIDWWQQRIVERRPNDRGWEWNAYISRLVKHGEWKSKETNTPFPRSTPNRVSGTRLSGQFDLPIGQSSDMLDVTSANWLAMLNCVKSGIQPAT